MWMALVPTVGCVGSMRLSLQSRPSFLVCRLDFQHKPLQVLSPALMSPLSLLSMPPLLSKVTEAVARVFKPCPFLWYLRASLVTLGVPCVHTAFADPFFCLKCGAIFHLLEPVIWEREGLWIRYAGSVVADKL